jgi:glyoxylase-like metal-dependent hydrolase (beta-lactamase superfamily II)
VRTDFVEVADRVFVLRYPVLDVNVTLIVGDEGALVVDTLSGEGQARELAGRARHVTTAALAVVNTHHHFDHCFGNATLAREGAAPIWAHHEAALELREYAETWREELVGRYRDADPELAAEIAAAEILPPTRIVHQAATLDVGGRRVELRHLGRGHTAGDLVVLVPDADLIVAGDLVEEGAPPSFSDAYPLEWPDTVAAMVALMSEDTVVVPGHGAPVARAFVQTQHAQLSELDWLIREGHYNSAPADAVAAKSPFGPGACLVAVERGYAELDGLVELT